MTAATAQRDLALQKANAIRLARAHIKQEIRSGERSIKAVLLNPPATVNTMAIADLLMSTRGFGRVRVNKLLSRARVSPNKAVLALTERQRRLIVEELRRL